MARPRGVRNAKVAPGDSRKWLSSAPAPVLFGSASEGELCQAVAGSIGPRACVMNLAGKTTLREFIDLAAACRLFLTNDSGASHIASALAVPTVTVFGATDDTTTGPTGPLARVVREHAECSPCLLRECPIDHRCMTRVTAGRVTGVAHQPGRSPLQRGHKQ
jgi:heptosyltransferase-2